MFFLGVNSSAAGLFQGNGLKAEGIVFDAQSADLSSTPQGGQIIHLKGRVQIVFQGQHLSCDEANIDTTKKEVEAVGHVTLYSTEVQAQGDRISLNYALQTGQITNGFIQMGQVQLEGALIEKTGPKTYEMDSGYYTSCMTCPPAWAFSGTRVTAEVGGYTYIRNPVLRLARVPVFWFPYLVVPLKTERQTGLLFPAFEYNGTGGFAVSQGLFWAMSPSQDSTWTLKNYDRRGLKGLGEYRYVLDQDSNGAMNSSYMHDRVLGNDRWLFKYRHIYEMPEGFSHTMNINLISDSFYPRDFPSEIEGVHGNPAVENRMSLSKNTESQHIGVDVAYYVNLLKQDPTADNSDAVHRFPEVKYGLMPQKLFGSNLHFNFDANYVNFARDNTTYDDRNPDGSVPRDTDGRPYYQGGHPYRDGVFDNSTDLIRTGQRFDFQPRLFYPIKLGQYVDLLPSVSYREQDYRFGVGDRATAERRYLRTEGSLRTRLASIYGDPSNIHENAYKHEVEPEVNYSAVPWFETTDHPFFGKPNTDPFFRANTAINDRDTIQFDYQDRLYNRNIATFSITNRLIRKHWLTEELPEYKQIVSLKVSQSYDFYEQYRQTNSVRQPYSDISMLLDVRHENFETNTLVRYFPYQQLTTNALRAKVSNSRGAYFQVTYSEDYEIINGITLDTTSRTEDVIGGAGIKTRYINLEGDIQYSLVNYLIGSFGFKIDVIPPGNCWVLSFNVRRATSTDPIVGFGFTFLFDGKNPNAPPEDPKETPKT